MKKLLALLVAVFYLGSTVGATVHLHYCMDKLVSWSLSDNDDDKCENCGMEKDGGCCKDEQRLIKNNADQKIAEPAIQLFVSSPVTSPLLNYGQTVLNSPLTIKYSFSHAPPGHNGADILILNSVFRI